MKSPPGRNTKPARSRKRRVWGAGTGGRITTVEKDGYGVFLHDVSYAFADISVPSLPMLYVTLVTADMSYFGQKSAALILWIAMVLTVATIRGGWVTPLLTDIPGWASITVPLVGLRLLYYNLVFIIATYGGGYAGSVLPTQSASVGFALSTGVVTMGVFPRLAQEVSEALSS